MLVAASAFYVVAPTVFAYVGEVMMTYSYVPQGFARSPQTRVTARLFADYNARDPRTPRLKRSLPCLLVDRGAKENPQCAHELRPGDSISGPSNLWIPRGVYSAEFDYSQNPGCRGGEAELQVATAGRFGQVLADFTGRMEGSGRIDLPFRLHLMDAALAPVEFRVTGRSGCVLLTWITWRDIPQPKDAPK